MPYSVVEDHPGCDGEPYAVTKDSDGELMGCHETIADAEAQIAALYASEQEASERALRDLLLSFRPPENPEDARRWVDDRSAELGALMAKAAAEITNAVATTYADTLTAAGDLAVLDALTDTWGAFVTEVVGEYTAGMYLSGSLSAWITGPAADLAPEVAAGWVSVVNEAALSYQATATNRIVGASASMWSDVRERVVQSVASGSTNEELKAAIEDVTGYSEFRADTIGRTEVQAAYSGGEMQGARALGEFGPTHKRWLAALDARTRETHAMADGQTVPINEPFDVGGVPMDRPLDPAAPASEVVNCRCTVELLYPEDVGE